MTAQPAPRGLEERGRRFWKQIMTDLELEAHETLMLEEVCRTIDRLEALHREIRGAPSMIDAEGKALPALVEARLQSVTLARLIASLRLPDEYRAELLDRGQRRGAARGVYKLRTVGLA